MLASRERHRGRDANSDCAMNSISRFIMLFEKACEGQFKQPLSAL